MRSSFDSGARGASPLRRANQRTSNYGVARTGGGYVYQKVDLPTNDIQSRSPQAAQPVAKKPEGDGEKLSKEQKHDLGTFLMQSSTLEGEVE